MSRRTGIWRATAATRCVTKSLVGQFSHPFQFDSMLVRGNKLSSVMRVCKLA